MTQAPPPDPDRDPPPDPDPADETRQFLTAVSEWAQRALPAPPSGHAGPECQWCPLCQLASVLRGEHPELTERLAEVGAAVATAARALLDNATRASASAPAPSGDSRRPVAEPPAAGPSGPGPSDRGLSDRDPSEVGAPPRRRPRPRIEHIPLDDTASGS